MCKIVPNVTFYTPPKNKIMASTASKSVTFFCKQSALI